MKTKNQTLPVEKHSFSKKVLDLLDYYVYALIDSNNNTIFYIGKGKGNRVFAHVKEAKKLTSPFPYDKYPKIKHIQDIGTNNVKHIIIRHGLTHEHALIVESVLIDLFRQQKELKLDSIESLDNKNNGFESQGIHSVEEIEEMYNAPEAIILPNEKILAINIKSDSNNEAFIYNQVKGFWVLDPTRAKKADYIVATHNGFIVGVFKQNEGTVWTPSTTDPSRFCFEGHIVTDDSVRNRLFHRTINRKQGSQNPIWYINNWK